MIERGKMDIPRDGEPVEVEETPRRLRAETDGGAKRYRIGHITLKRKPRIGRIALRHKPK